MENLREVAPFFVGMLIPPLVTIAAHGRWSRVFKSVASFVVALILGICTSAIAGELAAGFPDGLIAIMIDTSLAYTGSQLAYRLVWKPIQARRRQLAIGTAEA